MRLLLLAAAASLIGLSGCSCDRPSTLVVQLKTDFVPELELARVRTEVLGLRGGAGSSEVHPSFLDEDYIQGIRVAEFDDILPGVYTLRVSLEDQAGTVIAERPIRARFENNQAVTVIITRRCGPGACPTGADELTATACVDGRCADEACTVESPEGCPPSVCESDAECPTANPCSEPRCVDGVCLLEAVHTRCPGGTCNPDLGCIGIPDDAGVPTDAGACLADDDPCDDGLFCNGADRCGGGTCSVHEGDPCPGVSACDEGADECSGCAGPTDCPDPILGDYGPCGGFVGACGEAGTRSRTVTSFDCVGGTCVGSDSTEVGDCSRSTNGNSCGATTCTGWTCGGFSGTCGENGTESRTCMDRRCSGGSCSSSSRPESGGACMRNTDGIPCETRSHACGTRVCRECRGGACTINTPNFDASCTPSCGWLGTECGAAEECCPSPMSCGGSTLGASWDCDQCCSGATCT